MPLIANLRRGRDRLRQFREWLMRVLVLEHPAWSWVVVIGCVLRATSYYFRAPVPSPTSSRIEGVIPYPYWSAVLLLAAALISVGMLRRGADTLAYAGHLLGVLIYPTLALSIASAAVFDGEPWSGAWPLVVIALIHVGRALALGPDLRRALDARRRR